ncbi:MAG: quinone-dependent dihydroorotate dehydrogenase [Defluviicoccus sp.]|nr:quinone-dependent dihydroorotate dehydrogenase [Defluviicoccus sp.]
MIDFYPFVWPVLRQVEPERAHGLAIAALRLGLVPPACPVDAPSLRSQVWGLDFANPLGVAAGFDKNAQAVAGLRRLGLGFVETGTITPKPQAGNPRPRVFRLEQQEALINRLGFNNDGLAVVAARLSALQRGGCPIGANVGPNRDSPDPLADCAQGVRTLAGRVDYLVINVSSPNTPGLRALQAGEQMRRLWQVVQEARSEAAARTPLLMTPLLIKIAPDLDAGALAEIAAVALEVGVDGIIATNTTIERPQDLDPRYRDEAGGLSGRPLFDRSTAVLAALYRSTGGTIPLIGVGGVASGADAYAKIRAGASLVQLYTALVYQGPALIPRCLRALKDLLERDGFASVSAAVGVDSR